MIMMMMMMVMMMFLLDRRKTTEVLSISVPDLHAREVRLMLDLFYQGSVSLSGMKLDASIMMVGANK